MTERITLADAEARIAKALTLVDAWLAEEPMSDLDSKLTMQDIRAALTCCSHTELFWGDIDGDPNGVQWWCDDCGARMIIHRELTVDEARAELDEP